MNAGSLNKYVVEFIGAFFLVLTIGLTVIAPGAEGMAGLAIGSALMIMIFAGGHISGAHFNPAVTLAVYLRGKLPVADVGPYVVAQVLGGVVAALIAIFLKGGPAAQPLAIRGGGNVALLLVAEFLFTFALAWVVLNAATARGTAGNSFYGLAIGFTVMVNAYAIGGISGGAINPAVAVGAAIMNLLSWGNIWAYLLAQLLGGAAAAAAFRALSTDDREPEPIAQSAGQAAD